MRRTERHDLYEVRNGQKRAALDKRLKLPRRISPLAAMSAYYADAIDKENAVPADRRLKKSPP